MKDDRPHLEHRSESPGRPQIGERRGDAVVPEVADPSLARVGAGLDGGGGLGGLPLGHPTAGSARAAASLALQHTVGNAAVHRLLCDRAVPGPVPAQRRPDEAETTRDTTARAVRASDGAVLTAAAVPSAPDLVRRKDVKQAPAASPKARLAALERQQRVQTIKQDMTNLDQKWHGLFGSLLTNYQETVLRVTGGFESAMKGFQEAQMAQALTDQLQLQLLGALGTVVFASFFQTVVGRVGGKLFPTRNVKDFVELIENPANAVAQAAVNVQAARKAQKSAAEGQEPKVAVEDGDADPEAAGSALVYMTGRLESLMHFNRRVHDAFTSRAATAEKKPDEWWEKIDLAALESVYKKLYTEIAMAGSDVDAMKPAREVALVIERHMWAAWLMRSPVARVPANKRRNVSRAMSGMSGIGSDIEDRLTKVGISKADGVGGLANVWLTGHWFSGNEPDDWYERLLAWASSYNESINK
jgi:hypothetical protein